MNITIDTSDPKNVMTQDHIKDLRLKAEAMQEGTISVLGYIAAANPKTVLAFLTLNDRLVEALRCANDRLKTHGTKHIATVRIASEALSAAKQFNNTGGVG